MRIGVKFCGNCNPHTDNGSLLRALGTLHPDFRFLPCDQPGYEVLLVLCGCPAGCAKPPAFPGPTVFVTSQAIDCWPVAEGERLEKVGAALREALPR